MNKQEIVGCVAKRTGLTKKDAEAATNAVIEAVTNALVRNDAVKIAGFGIFEVKNRAARSRRNPQTNETVEIPAHKALVFKASKVLKRLLN